MSNILVIEDEASMAEFMMDMLESEGYEVDHAPDGKEGMDLYHREDYDLVITDMIMPEMQGKEVCEQLLQDKQPPEIIAMSAGFPELLESVSLMGVNYTFTKPFKVPEFLNSVSQALETQT